MMTEAFVDKGGLTLAERAKQAYREQERQAEAFRRAQEATERRRRHEYLVHWLRGVMGANYPPVGDDQAEIGAGAVVRCVPAKDVDRHPTSLLALVLRRQCEYCEHAVEVEFRSLEELGKLLSQRAVESCPECDL